MSEPIKHVWESDGVCSCRTTYPHEADLRARLALAQAKEIEDVDLIARQISAINTLEAERAQAVARVALLEDFLRNRVEPLLSDNADIPKCRCYGNSEECQRCSVLFDLSVVMSPPPLAPQARAGETEHE